MKTAIITILTVAMTSCCCQRQGAPALRPMPKCEQQQQPTLQIPVERTGK